MVMTTTTTSLRSTFPFWTLASEIQVGDGYTPYRNGQPVMINRVVQVEDDGVRVQTDIGWFRFGANESVPVWHLGGAS